MTSARMPGNDVHKMVDVTGMELPWRTIDLSSSLRTRQDARVSRTARSKTAYLHASESMRAAAATRPIKESKKKEADARRIERSAIPLVSLENSTAHGTSTVSRISSITCAEVIPPISASLFRMRR